MNTALLSSRFSPPSDLSKYQGFIFDCDGTLADSMPVHFQAWRQGLLAAGANFDFTWDIFLSRAGMSLEGTVAELSRDFGATIDMGVLLREKARVFEELQSTIQPIDEVVHFAREVAGRFPVAVASGGSRANVDYILRQVGLGGLFPIVLTPVDVNEGKPAPDMFLLAAQMMGVAPELCLVLEDGASGIEAARRAGMDYLVVDPAPQPNH